MKIKNLFRFSLYFSRGRRWYSFKSRVRSVAWELLVCFPWTVIKYIALPTVVSKELTDGGGKELADVAIYVLDLLQGFV